MCRHCSACAAYRGARLPVLHVIRPERRRGTAAAIQDALAETAEGEGQRVVDKAPPGPIKTKWGSRSATSTSAWPTSAPRTRFEFCTQPHTAIEEENDESWRGLSAD